MIRQLLGDRAVNILKRIPLIHGLYTWLIHHLRHTIPGFFPKAEYRLWVKYCEPTLVQPIDEALLREEIDVIIDLRSLAHSDCSQIIASIEQQTLLPRRVSVVGSSECDLLWESPQGPQPLHVVNSSSLSQIAESNQRVCVWIAAPGKLSESALMEFARARRDHGFSLAYADEDQLAKRNRREKPFFKTDFNEFLLRQVNYLGGVVAIGTDSEAKALLSMLIEAKLPLDVAVIQRLEDNDQLRSQIHHVTSVLFHNQDDLASQLLTSNTRSSALRLANQSAAENTKNQPSLGVMNNQYRRADQPLVSILIPTRDHYTDLKLCVESVFEKTRYENFELIVVDNGSTCEETLAYLDVLRTHEAVQVLQYSLPFNYSRINNFAARVANGEVLVLLNNDTEVISPEWLDDMLGILAMPKVGCVGAKLLYHDGSIQHAGVSLGPGGYAGHSHRYIEPDEPGYFYFSHLTHSVSAVTAACLAVETEVFWSVGGLDEEFAVAYNDVDFCLQVIKAGYQNVYCASAELYHYESKSRGLDDTPEKRARFDNEKALLTKKWQGVIDNDPMYSPHLTRNGEDFRIRTSYS
ncbi:glycosyltransferase family 2 protein [uncultured Umboniibacter sp.]|uniref:glycosyltransferase family 2 protein n=1 Tax=uncultured Umboniibacter sp. TaxID=1798917 RepID=UPI00260EC18F|nr:glycosyltransferase family 2 protein [uncultured Umboniibacter sp.]